MKYLILCAVLLVGCGPPDTSAYLGCPKYPVGTIVKSKLVKEDPCKCMIIGYRGYGGATKVVVRFYKDTIIEQEWPLCEVELWDD